MFNIYCNVFQYRSRDDTQEIWSFVLFIKKSTCKHEYVSIYSFWWTRQRIKSPEYNRVICIAKTKCTSDKGLLNSRILIYELRLFVSSTQMDGKCPFTSCFRIFRLANILNIKGRVSISSITVQYVIWLSMENQATVTIDSQRPVFLLKLFFNSFKIE